MNTAVTYNVEMPHINDPFPFDLSAGSMRLVSVDGVPVYGSFWRWLLRRPKHYDVKYEFEVKPEFLGV